MSQPGPRLGSGPPTPGGPPPGQPARGRPFAAFRHRDYALFWGGLTFSGIGSQFTTIAMSWQIYEITGSPLQIGLLGLSRGVPAVLLILFGGLLADALDRRRLLIITVFGQLVVTLGLVGITAVDAVSPLVLYGASVLLAVCGSLEAPARQAIIPSLVPRADFTNAVALNSTQRNVAMVAGPSVAGVAFAIGGGILCYSVNAVSWVVMLGVLAIIRARPQPVGSRGAVSMQSLREGIAFAWKHPILFSMMAIDFGQNMFGNVRSLLPIFAGDILQVGPEGYGILSAASAAGAIVAAAGMASIGHVRRAAFWVLFGVSLFAICTIAFALSTSFWLSVALLAGTGIGNSISTVLRGSIVQLSTPDELRGRVSSVNMVFTNSGPQLGQFQTGAIGEVIGPAGAAALGGVAILGIAGAIGCRRVVRKFELAP